MKAGWLVDHWDGQKVAHLVEKWAVHLVLWKAEQRDVWWVAQLVEKTGDQMVVLTDSAKVDHWGELKAGCLVERLVVHLVLRKVGW